MGWGFLGDFESELSSAKWKDVCLELEGAVQDVLDGPIPTL